MRLLSIALVVTACASTPKAAAPTVLTATVAATPAEATRRVIALFTRDGVPIAGSDGTVITTAAVDRLALSAGAGAARSTATVEYFFRASVSGDTVSTVALSLWGRVVSRDVAEREQPVPPTCSTTPKCATLHARLRAYATALGAGQ